MSIAVVILCTGGYFIGARVMFHTLRKYGKLTDGVDCFALGVSQCDFAEPLPIEADYSWVSVNQQYFSRVADKFQALILPYQRIILMDADMLCVGDCSYLWSDSIWQLPFYACRDTASVIYYGDIIRRIGLDSARLFNAGTMIFQMDRLPPTFYTDLMKRIRDKSIEAYDGGDQGYLNAYFQSTASICEIGFLPPEYNESYDVNMPSLPEHAKRIIHFTGPNANPWQPRLSPGDPRWKWIERWRAELEECNS